MTMATCKDCLHYEVCKAIENELDMIPPSQCGCFKDKSRFIELPCKPMSLVTDGNSFNTDVYCPYCGTNLSGYYGDAPQYIIQCFNCGEFLDNTKSVTYEEFQKELKEREQE